MGPSVTLIGAKAREAILKGVNAIYEPVKRTLGPEGRNALLFRTWGRQPRITNDGYTVAQCQDPRDVFVRQAAEMFKEACSKTNEKVGDGTTTTTVIAGKLYNDLHQHLASNTSVLTSTIGVRSLRNKILATAEAVKAKIKERATLIDPKDEDGLETLEKIAIVSTGDEKIGKIVADLAWKVGVDGFIDVTEGWKDELEVEFREGMRFHAKVPAKGFVNNPAKFEMVVKDYAVVITNCDLTDNMMVGRTIKPILQEADNQLIIMAPEFSSQVLEDFFRASYNVNQDGTITKKPNISIWPVAIKSLRTEVMEDIAIFCGANLIDKNKRAFSSLKPQDAGFLEKLIVKDVEAKEDAIITGGKGTKEVVRVTIKDIEVKKQHENGTEYITKEKVSEEVKIIPVAERIEVLKGQLKLTQTENFKNILRRRIGGMQSSMADIKVGDTTRASSLYKKLKIEDAVYACKSALRMGYVKGGGLCLKEIAEELPDDDMLKAALMEPYKLIQESFDGEHEISDDVIDPAEVPYYSVEHAVGVVANLITCDIITAKYEPPMTGEGELEIAKALAAYTNLQRRYYGLKKENDELEWDQAMGGLSPQEYAEANENK